MIKGLTNKWEQKYNITIILEYEQIDYNIEKRYSTLVGLQ